MTDTFSTNAMKIVAITDIKIHGSDVSEITVQCRTSAYSEYSALAAHAGICTVTPILSEKSYVVNSGVTTTLVIAGTSYSSAAIKTITAAEVNDSMADIWDYQITFAIDTTT